MTSDTWEAVGFTAYSVCAGNTLELTLSRYDGAWIEMTTQSFTVSNGGTVAFDLSASPVGASRFRIEFDSYTCSIGVREIFVASADCDADGYYDTDVTGGDDCDDANNTVFPGATEICDDDIDQDCDGMDTTCPETGDTGLDDTGGDTAVADTGRSDTADSTDSNQSGSVADSSSDTGDTAGQQRCVKVDSDCGGCGQLIGCPPDVFAALLLPLFGWGLRRRRSQLAR